MQWKFEKNMYETVNSERGKVNLKVQQDQLSKYCVLEICSLEYEVVLSTQYGCYGFLQKPPIHHTLIISLPRQNCNHFLPQCYIYTSAEVAI